MIRYIKTACLVVVVAIALVSAVFFSYKCIRQATADAAPEETTEMTEATETVPPETAATTVSTEETVPEETAAETTLPEETVPVETEAPKVTIDAVPHYHQSEYPDIRYGNGTIATSGSSVAALAMVATYMTDHVYTPADIADYAVQYGGSPQPLQTAGKGVRSDADSVETGAECERGAESRPGREDRHCADGVEVGVSGRKPFHRPDRRH